VTSLREQIREAVADAVVRSGVRQAAIAEDIGVSQKHLSRVLNGRDRLSPELADQIMDALGRRILITHEPVREGKFPLTLSTGAATQRGGDHVGQRTPCRRGAVDKI
jgi:transcriptional regulator with XRE-family HTH domain